jgi:hypothetical protein
VSVFERRYHRRGWRSRRSADEEADLAEVDGRIDRLAPRLWILGKNVARVLAHNVNDERLLEAGAVVAASTTSGMLEHPILRNLREQIIARLSDNPAFEGETRAAVIALTDHMLTFLLDRYDRGGPVLPGRPNILRKLSKDDARPLEEELQWEFYAWVATSAQFAGRAQCEMSSVATGRVDVIVRIGSITLSTEVKRELENASEASLQKYVPQAAAYSGSNVPFSQLLVLDLTDHASGVPPLADLVWVVEHTAAPDASSQHVVGSVAPGNRPTPSDLRPAR